MHRSPGSVSSMFPAKMFSKSSDKSNWIDCEDVRVLVRRKYVTRCDGHPPEDDVKITERARTASGDNVQLVLLMDHFPVEARSKPTMQIIGEMDNRIHSRRGKAYPSKEATNVDNRRRVQCFSPDTRNFVVVMVVIC